jgi:hypothetical protein
MGGKDGDRLTIFSGLHGAGTRAIDLVFRDQRLLERIYQRTKRLLGWQTVIQVTAKNTHTPESVGDFTTFELTGIDFDHPKSHVRNHLQLDQKRIKNLIEMLPPNEEVDLSDSSITGLVIELEEHDFWKRRFHRKTRKELSRPGAKPSASESRGPVRSRRAPSSRMHSDSTYGRHTAEISTNRTDIAAAKSTMVVKRRPGRPPKEKSDATLTHRFALLLSEEDIARVNSIMQREGLGSMGQAIRDAIRCRHEDIVGSEGVIAK